MWILRSEMNVFVTISIVALVHVETYITLIYIYETRDSQDFVNMCTWYYLFAKASNVKMTT